MTLSLCSGLTAYLVVGVISESHQVGGAGHRPIDIGATVLQYQSIMKVFEIAIKHLAADGGGGVKSVFILIVFKFN